MITIEYTNDRGLIVCWLRVNGVTLIARSARSAYLAYALVRQAFNAMKGLPA
jgi:hypothetical protein